MSGRHDGINSSLHPEGSPGGVPSSTHSSLALAHQLAAGGGALGGLAGMAGMGGMGGLMGVGMPTGNTSSAPSAQLSSAASASPWLPVDSMHPAALSGSQLLALANAAAAAGGSRGAAAAGVYPAFGPSVPGLYYPYQIASPGSAGAMATSASLDPQSLSAGPGVTAGGGTLPGVGFMSLLDGQTAAAAAVAQGHPALQVPSGAMGADHASMSAYMASMGAPGASSLMGRGGAEAAGSGGMGGRPRPLAPVALPPLVSTEWYPSAVTAAGVMSSNGGMGGGLHRATCLSAHGGAVASGARRVGAPGTGGRHPGDLAPGDGSHMSGTAKGAKTCTATDNTHLLSQVTSFSAAPRASMTATAGSRGRGTKRRDPSANSAGERSDGGQAAPGEIGVSKRKKPLEESLGNGTGGEPGLGATMPYFSRGTIIQLGEDRMKLVEDLTTSDFIDSAEASEHLQMDCSLVSGLDVNEAEGTLRVTFVVRQGETPQEVDAKVYHPFFVINAGWASADPKGTEEKYKLPCRRLQKGDQCVTLRRA